MDDIKGSKRARISDQDGCLRGIFWHMQGKLDPRLSTFADGQRLRELIDSGQVQYATEITNVAIAANAETGYKPIIVATSGGCLNGDPIARTERLLDLVIKVWKTDRQTPVGSSCEVHSAHCSRTARAVS
eukprot:828204-Prymnesium_polylepis.2